MQREYLHCTSQQYQTPARATHYVAAGDDIRSDEKEKTKRDGESSERPREAIHRSVFVVFDDGEHYRIICCDSQQIRCQSSAQSEILACLCAGRRKLSIYASFEHLRYHGTITLIAFRSAISDSHSCLVTRLLLYSDW